MRRHLFLTWPLIVFFSLGCGGGGKKAGFPARTDSFTVGANQSSSQRFGEIGLEVPAGAFPNGAQLTLKQKGQAEQLPPTDNFKLIKPALELVSSSSANKDIVVSIADDGQNYIAGAPNAGVWTPLRLEKANARINFTLPASAGRAADRGPGVVWNWLIGLVKDNLPDKAFGVHLVAGSGPLGPGSAIIVHGIMDNNQSMKKMAEMLLPRLGWKNVYSVAYDWPLSTPEVADHLAGVLTPLAANPKTIDLVGHSRGAIIVRYTMEKLEKTAAVRNCYLFCGPHLGSGAANIADLWFELAKEWLSSTYVCAPPTLAEVNDPAFEELIIDSSFLTELNRYGNKQRGRVNYYLIASQKDNIVTTDSALASSVTLEELTGGSIARFTLAGATHGSVKRRQTDIDDFLRQHGLTFSSLEVWAEPDPVDFNGEINGWQWILHIRNSSNLPLTIDNLAFEIYDENGNWYVTQWFDPNTPDGTPFPTSYVRWGERLDAGATLTENIHTRGSNNPLYRALSNVLIAQTDQFGGSDVTPATAQLVLHNGDIWPSPAKTRSRRSPHEERPGLIGPAKP